MAELTPVVVTLDGVADNLVAADEDGDSFPCTNEEVLEVNNGGGASINVTINSQKLIYGEDVDKVVAVPAGARRKIGKFPRARFADEDGLCHVSYSAVTSVTVQVLRMTAGNE